MKPFTLLIWLTFLLSACSQALSIVQFEDNRGQLVTCRLHDKPDGNSKEAFIEAFMKEYNNLASDMLLVESCVEDFFAEEVLRFERSPENSLLIAATVSNQKPVGYLFAKRYGALVSLKECIVVPTHQRRGIAHGMCLALIQELRKTKLTCTVHKKNEHRRRIAFNIGFEKLESMPGIFAVDNILTETHLYFELHLPLEWPPKNEPFSPRRSSKNVQQAAEKLG
ncbi:GNAT family N-acetyltransferase [bacterium]|nr:GNAT family N-acetyltransferase [bacterium]